MKNYGSMIQEILSIMPAGHSDANINLVKKALNDTYFEVVMDNNFSFRLVQGNLRTTAPYTTGKVATATQNGRSLVGSGTTWTSKMVGRRIRLGDANESYKIASVESTTGMTLEDKYDGSTITDSVSYSLYKSTYSLKHDFTEALSFKQNESPIALGQVKRKTFENVIPNPTGEGTVINYIDSGFTQKSFYSTGTVTVSLDGTTVTGSGTTFDSEMAGMAFRIQGDMVSYNIDSVTGTTALKLNEGYLGAKGTTLKYEVNPSGIREVEFYQIPDDSKNIPYWYYYKPREMVKDWDVPIIQPDTYHDVIVLGAKARLGLGDPLMFERRRDSLIAADTLNSGVRQRDAFLGGSLRQSTTLPQNWEQ